MYKTKRPITVDHTEYLDRKRAAALKTIQVETFHGKDSIPIFSRVYPYWKESVMEAGYSPVECTIFLQDDEEFLMTGVFQDLNVALTGGYNFILGSHDPIKMARFLWHSYPQIIEYYVEKYGSLTASALRDCEEPNRLLIKGGFAFIGQFDYNDVGYNAYRIDGQCLHS